MRITQLRHDDGYWRARVHLPTPPDGTSTDVDRRYGSWRITPEREGEGYQMVTPAIAAALQERVRTEERRARRAAA